MALTIVDQPPKTLESAYSQIVYGLSSDRDEIVTDTVTAVASNLFNAEMTVGTHSFSAGDTVTASGFTVSAYNGTFQVLETSGTTITLNVTFTSTDTGTVDLANTNFAVSSKIGLLGINTVYSISAIDTPTPPAVGLNLTRFIRTDIPVNEVESGDLISIFGTFVVDVRRVWEVKGVTQDSGDTLIEIKMNIGDTIGTTTGSIEVLGKLSLSYPEKFSDGITISGDERYRLNQSNILQSLIGKDLPALGLANIQNGTLIKPGILFTEWHDDQDGFREDYETESINNVEYLDTVFQHTDTSSIIDYYLDNPSTGLFLTNSPSSQDIIVGEEIQLSFLSPSETDVRIRYETFDLAGASNGAFNLTGVTITSYKAIAPINSNIISAAISRADVWIARVSDDAQFSEKKTLNVVSNCNTDRKRIWFHNPRGGYDAFTFTGTYESELKSKAKTYTKPLPYQFNIEDRGGSIAKKDNRFEYSVFSDFLTLEKREWLVGLIDSTDVFLEENGEFVPILITKTDIIVNSENLTSININYTNSNKQITKIG